MSADLHRLNQIGVGQKVRLEAIDGDHQLIRKLLGLGIRIGTNLTITQRRGAGVVVANQGARVAIGPGLADKLHVSLEN
jgi:ferrous iron transport protein A